MLNKHLGCACCSTYAVLPNNGVLFCHLQDLVQIALVESNSARDNRIIYPKLVKIVDL
jgi:hypothetical protein